ncbi:MAG TPA: carbohydrate ABC transporter permease [Bacilli bacterium]|jgi:multiple sugar transport system permease protein|nr:carbohydrate ABC transporter permease [Bacilli bacterium]HPX21098.1 carbohydrate ABC transporter permease [Bacilli bacterium]HRS31098.1 carbohydrate ABC transporter permease [Bacilli bacterium]HRU49753.1 carbohydrate ABC transporter permease [Bacilli bacterium]
MTRVVTDYQKENRNAIIKAIVLRVLCYIFLCFVAVMCIFFFYLLLVNTTRANNDLQGGRFTLMFSRFFNQNFKNLFTKFKTDFDALKGFRASFVIAFSSAVLTCYFSALTAYGIYAYDFKGKRLMEAFILAIMMIPPQLSSVGFFQIASRYGLKNNWWILILPSIAAPSVFFYMIQYLRATLPKDLIESSRIDGSNEFMTFNRIVLPIMKPAIAVQMIFSFVGSWNNLYMPSLLLSDSKKKTLPVMINALQRTSWGNIDLGCVYMAIFLSILPVVIVYLFLSKFIIKGVTAGSVKG